MTRLIALPPPRSQVAAPKRASAIPASASGPRVAAEQYRPDSRCVGRLAVERRRDRLLELGIGPRHVLGIGAAARLARIEGGDGGRGAARREQGEREGGHGQQAA